MKYSVTFLPQNVTVKASVGDTILDAALDGGIDIPNECGGNCACTTCHVIVEEGQESVTAMEGVERDRLATATGWTPASRLACQAILAGSGLTVRIPEAETW